MDQPYQPPLAEPPEPPAPLERESKKPDFALLSTVIAFWILQAGLMTFAKHYRSFEHALSGIPDAEVPVLLRLFIPRLQEQRIIVACMGVAVLAMFLSYTRQAIAARVLAFGALAFALPLAAIAAYLASKSPAL